jgi:O-antigen biosynthesis protein WbqP
LKRLFDLFLVLLSIAVLILQISLIALIVNFTSRGSVLYWSERLGKHNQVFRMPKFRSMVIGTPEIATHLFTNPNAYLTPIGSFLRKNSLDELHQLWCIFLGDMSFVGQRPAFLTKPI